MTVLAATADQTLLDDIRRLATVSAQDLHCVGSVAQAQSLWSEAKLVFLGTDLISEVRAAALPKRSEVVVVARAGATDTVWREAMSVGADHVAQLPDEESWLIDRLAQLAVAEGKQGTVVAVIGGSGGVGCSSFVAACAVAAVAQRKSPVVVDLDPGGCGLDVVLGCDEEQPGVRWSELYRVSGRIPGKSLLSGLPVVGQVPVLSWGDSPRQLPSNEALAVVLDSLRTTYDLIFLDLSRYAPDLAAVAFSRAQVVSLIAKPGVIGAVAAQRSAAWILASHPTVDLIVRQRAGKPLRPDAAELGHLLGVDPLLVIPECKRIVGELESGWPPGTDSDSKLGAAAAKYVKGLDQLRQGESDGS